MSTEITLFPGARKEIATWVASRIRDMGPPPQRDYEAIGVCSDGKLIGGVIYTMYHELLPGQYDIQMSCAGDPGWLTRKTLRMFFSYPFKQLNCVRVTALVAKSNKRARDMNERLGFRMEGCIRDGYGIGRDGILLGMQKRDCKWI